MLKYTIYNGSQLQTFKSMLDQFESEGITDVRFMRQRIQEELDKRFKVGRAEARKVRKEPVILCPSCKKGVKMGKYKIEEIDDTLINVLLCKSCGYSKAVE